VLVPVAAGLAFVPNKGDSVQLKARVHVA
jgi:hypothetical protein